LTVCCFIGDLILAGRARHRIPDPLPTAGAHFLH